MACRDIIKAKITVNDPETGDSHATTSQGMHFFTCLYLFALAIIVVLPLTVIVQLLFSLLNLEVSCFFDFCKDPLSTFKLFYYFLFYGYLLLKKLANHVCGLWEECITAHFPTNEDQLNNKILTMEKFWQFPVSWAAVHGWHIPISALLMDKNLPKNTTLFRTFIVLF